MQGTYISELGYHFVKTCFSLYWDGIYFFPVFLAGIMVLFFLREKVTRYIGVYVVFLFLTVFNPVLVKVFVGPLEMDDVYYRFIWLLPVQFVLAYLAVRLIDRAGYAAVKIILIAGITVGIVCGGTPVKTWQQILTRPENLYKVESDILQISDIIQEHSSGKEPRVAAAYSVLVSIRQYDASIHQTISRDNALCWQGAANFQGRLQDGQYKKQKALMDTLYGGATHNKKSFRRAVKRTATEFLVFSKSVDVRSFVEEQGFIQIGETARYYVYQLMDSGAADNK